MPRAVTVIYRFGDFELHPHTGRLLRAGHRVRLGSIPMAILIHLVVNAPHVVEKDAIERVGWGGTASLSSLEKAISRLRRALGDASGSRYVETVPFCGYRFAAPVEEIELLDAGMSETRDRPFRRFEEGRRELATLKRQSIVAARRTLDDTVTSAPKYAPAHAALATACALAFEATRFDATCDFEALTRAVHHARLGTTLDPDCADAWSALGFALHLQGKTHDATGAARTAVALDSGSWRHWLRLAFVSWGDDRLEAALEALRLRPHLALAHWMRGSVFVARAAFDIALPELGEGCAAQDTQPADEASYPAVGLHLQRGLVLAALGRLDEASRDFEAELAAGRGQVYSQECDANTWYALGAIRLRQQEYRAAEAAFQQALVIAPAHLFSMAALGKRIPDLEPSDPRAMDAVIAHAIGLARGNRHREAAEIYREGLAGARTPNAGWILPVEPILRPLERPEVWAAVLEIVRQRAT